MRKKNFFSISFPVHVTRILANKIYPQCSKYAYAMLFCSLLTTVQHVLLLVNPTSIDTVLHLKKQTGADILKSYVQIPRLVVNSSSI